MALNVLIVTNTGETNNGAAIESLLEGRGDTATVIDDNAAVNTAGYDVVVIADPSSGGAAYLAEAVGIVVMDRSDWGGLNLDSSNSGGANQTAIDVKDDAHPIAVAAGLTLGMNTISSGTSVVERVNPGGLAAGGVRIADDSTATDGRVVLFAYEAGAALTTGTAAGRRVGFGHYDPAVWNALGQDVFFACVDYAAGVIGDGGDETFIAAWALGSNVVIK